MIKIIGSNNNIDNNKVVGQSVSSVTKIVHFFFVVFWMCWCYCEHFTLISSSLFSKQQEFCWVLTVHLDLKRLIVKKKKEIDEINVEVPSILKLGDI